MVVVMVVFIAFPYLLMGNELIFYTVVRKTSAGPHFTSRVQQSPWSSMECAQEQQGVPPPAESSFNLATTV